METTMAQGKAIGQQKSGSCMLFVQHRLTWTKRFCALLKPTTPITRVTKIEPFIMTGAATRKPGVYAPEKETEW